MRISSTYINREPVSLKQKFNTNMKEVMYAENISMVNNCKYLFDGSA